MRLCVASVRLILTLTLTRGPDTRTHFSNRFLSVNSPVPELTARVRLMGRVKVRDRVRVRVRVRVRFRIMVSVSINDSNSGAGELEKSIQQPSNET